MDLELEREELRNEILVGAAGSAGLEVESFASVYAAKLEEAEQVFDFHVEPLKCLGPRGRRLELLGYAEDPTDGSLTVLAGRYGGWDSVLGLTEAKEVAGRATAFLESSANGWLQENLEISSREAEYAEYFAAQLNGKKYSRLRVVVITNGLMSDRIKAIPSSKVLGLNCSYEIWDRKRLLDSAHPGAGSESIRVDFTDWLPEGLPCLIADSSDETTSTYLAVLPAGVLASVFDEYGSLLLESNVRTFLSARGAVNKGIQGTLRHEPERFLAYNNGLTTTATGVMLGRGPSGTTIRSIDRWQIVNGGQTTASLLYFLRQNKSNSLDDVFVQMKLVMVSEEESAEIVQAVAKYANSQNRVTGADLFSTHEYHVRMEQMSRRLKAPAHEGDQFRTGWFYERARGQWENDRLAAGTRSAQKRFELEYPRKQKIVKTDLARYIVAWDMRPDLVSKGAQSVFSDFASAIDKAWTADESQFGDGYFKSCVGQAILFNETRTAVMRQEWYKNSTGYLANITAYAVSRFALEIGRQFGGSQFDWEKVWRNQALSNASLDGLLRSARLAQMHLTDSRRPQANVTQWAKQEACWKRFSEVPLTLPDAVRLDLLDRRRAQQRSREERVQREMDSGFEQIERVLNVDQFVWEEIVAAGRSAGLSPIESDLVLKVGVHRTIPVPSERQAAKLLSMFRRLEADGTIARGSF